MTDPIGILGCGVIGASWAKLAVAHGHHVVLYDARIEVAHTVERTLGSDVEVCDSAAEVAELSRFIFECGPEDLDVKGRLLQEVDRSADRDTVIASSSSGLLASEVQGKLTRHPERFLIAHPINPPHLLPIVEVVPARDTEEWATELTMDLLRAMGRRPVRLRTEIPGHVINRLQSAMWREAFWLVEQGVVTVKELDEMIAYGPGLRWAVLGPLANLQLSGGAGGIAHNLTHLGPAMAMWWETLQSPNLTPDFIESLQQQMNTELDGRTNPQWEEARDRVVASILALKADEEALP